MSWKVNSKAEENLVGYSPAFIFIPSRGFFSPSIGYLHGHPNLNYLNAFHISKARAMAFSAMGAIMA